MTFLEKGENIERENKSMRERGKKFAIRNPGSFNYLWIPNPNSYHLVLLSFSPLPLKILELFVRREKMREREKEILKLFRVLFFQSSLIQGAESPREGRKQKRMRSRFSCLSLSLSERFSPFFFSLSLSR